MIDSHKQRPGMLQSVPTSPLMSDTVSSHFLSSSPALQGKLSQKRAVQYGQFNRLSKSPPRQTPERCSTCCGIVQISKGSY